ADYTDRLVVDLAPGRAQRRLVHPVVDEALEGPSVLGPVLDLLDRALDLAARHRDGTAGLGDEDAPQPLPVESHRVVQLGQAVVAELQIPRPVGLVEGPACRP